MIRLINSHIVTVETSKDCFEFPFRGSLALCTSVVTALTIDDLSCTLHTKGVRFLGDKWECEQLRKVVGGFVNHTTQGDLDSLA